MTWVALVDTAQDAGLHGLVKQSRHQECLFSGSVPHALAAASPHLVLADRREPLMKEWQERGRASNWGIFCDSSMNFDELRRHFKKFLNAQLPDGTVALFRFYDPRVFTTYIRACTPAERAPWFKGVSQYLVEADDRVRHVYSLQEDQLFDGPNAVGS